MSSNGWYIIVNPSSGGGISKKKLTKIRQCLKENNIFGRLNKTSPQVSAKSLVGKGIQQGFRRIICIGGDGTVHNLVNGILNQTNVNPKDIVIGLIPMGTGNDWARHHNIPTNYKKAISIIAKENVDQQDVGELRILNGARKAVYFINYAGVGFDGYVISKIEKYKFLGPLSYLIAAIGNFISFENIKLNIKINSSKKTVSAFMLGVGICKYTGGASSRYGLHFIMCWSVFGVIFLYLSRISRNKIEKESETLHELSNNYENIAKHRRQLTIDSSLGALFGRSSIGAIK